MTPDFFSPEVEESTARRAESAAPVAKTSAPLALGWYVPTKRGYAGRQRPRWLLAVGNGRVVYATGGSQHTECLAGTFLAWMRRTAAEYQPDVVPSPSRDAAQLEIT